MTKISPLAFIGEDVEIGNNVAVGPGASILGPAIIEDDVYIGAGAQIGGPPEISSLNQNSAWVGEIEHAGVVIKKGAVIREGAIIHQGSYRATTVGANSWILNRAYLAHDVLIGSNVTVSAGVSIGGHVVVGDQANIGMNTSVHQYRLIGAGAMIGMGTPLTYDVPPFAKVLGSPARLVGVNGYVLKKLGLPAAAPASLLNYFAAEDGLTELPKTIADNAQEFFDAWRTLKPEKPIPVSIH